MLKFEIICLLKVDNEDKSLKSSAREFHSLMDDGIQDYYVSFICVNLLNYN